MKVGDIIMWRLRAPHFRAPRGDPHDRKYGLIIGKDGIFFKILWEDGTINGNIERQMKVVNESR